MLFVSWQLQLQTTVCVIFLTLCLGQELFRTCEQEYCFERSIKRQRFEREQSRRLSSNDRIQSDERFNNILDNREIRSFKETPTNSRIKDETASEFTRAEEGRKVWDQYHALQQLNERFEASPEQRSRRTSEERLDKGDDKKSLCNNREGSGKVLERFHEGTQERISNRAFESSQEQRYLDGSREYYSIPDLSNRLYNNREKNYKVLERFDESTHEIISDRDSREGRRTLEQRGYLARRVINAGEMSRVIQQRYEGNKQKQVDRQNTLQRFAVRVNEATKSLDGRRESGHRNEKLQRAYRNEGEENGGLSISRQTLLNVQGDDSGNIHRRIHLRQIEINTRSDHTDESIVRKIRELEQRQELIYRNSYPKVPQNLQNQIEISEERHGDDEVSQRSENRRKTERTENVMFRTLYDDRDSRRDISHRHDNLLSVQRSDNKEPESSRRSENASQDRRIDHQYLQETPRRIDPNELLPRINRRLIEPRDRKSIREPESTSSELKYEVRSTRDNHNIHQKTSQRLHESELQSKEQERTDPVTQKREELTRNSRLYADQGVGEHRSLRLEDECEKYLRELNNRENGDMRERVEKCLERRVDREIQRDLSRHLASQRQDIAQPSENRRFHEREMRRSSQDTQRLRLDNSERNKRGVSSRQYTERNVGYDKNHERESVHRDERFERSQDMNRRGESERNVSVDEKHERESVSRSERRDERFENRNVESRLNDQGRFPDKQCLERNNAFIIEPKSANLYYRNNRFIEQDNIKKPTVLLFNGYAALGQGLLFAYVIMKTCNGKNDLKIHLQTKLCEALRIIGF